jgi:tetratricopeptide (TPR) repeat protein
MVLIIFASVPHVSAEEGGWMASSDAKSTAGTDSRSDGFQKSQQPTPEAIAKYAALEGGEEHERAPDPIEALIQKAHSYHRQQQYKQAIRFYEEVLKIQPESIEARFNLASARIATEQYSKALPVLEELKRLQPDNADILLNLAIIAICLGRPLESLSLLDAVEKLKPEAQFEVCMHRGVAYRKIENYDQALYWYQQAYSLNRTHRQLLFNMALAYDGVQLFTEAVHFYRLYLTQTPDIDIAEKNQIEKRIRYLTAFVHATSSTGSTSF